MSKPIKQLAFITVAMLVLDGIYLTLNKSLFENQVKAVQNTSLEFNVLGAVLCYPLLVGGLYYFIIREKKSVFDAFLLGLVIYGFYETTNLAILANWRLSTVVLDTLWGAFLMAAVTFLTYRILG